MCSNSASCLFLLKEADKNLLPTKRAVDGVATYNFEVELKLASVVVGQGLRIWRLYSEVESPRVTMVLGVCTKIVVYIMSCKFEYE